jgi:predicted ATPase
MAFFEQVTGMLQILARRHPLLLLLDDLQWADSGSLSLLFHLGRHLAGSRILIVGAYRPDDLAQNVNGDRHPLETVVNELKRDFGEIRVDLAQAENRQFVDAYINTQPNRLDFGFREMLFQHTEGNALFTVELLRGMTERGDLVQDASGSWIERANLDWELLPARVEAVIAERIGRLPQECQALLATASVEGEEFTAEVVARLQGVAEMEIIHCLSGSLKNEHALVRPEELQRVGRRRRSRYRFQHILFQKYLYNHLDPAERSRLHEAIGEALESIYPDLAPELAVQLAWHFELAGLPERAVDYYIKAGKRAVQLSAHTEAIDHFMRAIALLQSLPETRERDQKELNLQISLFVPLIGVRGWSAPEQTRAFNRTLELSRKIGPNPDDLQLFQHLYAMTAYHFAQGEFSRSVALSEHLLSLARQSQDPADEVVARMILGANKMFLGELVHARDHLEQAWALYDPDRLRPMTTTTGIEVGVFLRGYQTIIWWLLGYPDHAWQTAQAMLSQAQDLNHPLSLDFAQAFLVPLITFLIHGSLRSFQDTPASLQSFSENDRAFFSHYYAILQGFIQVELGEKGEGIAQMQRGIADLPMAGIQVGRPALLYLLATAQLKANQPDQGLASIHEILPLLENTNQYWLSGFYQIKGELLVCRQHAMAGGQNSDEVLSLAFIQEAENCFLKAIEVARRQGAKSWELKATIDLARLWQQQGKKEAAHQMLEAIYSWFTEGFDTSDLIEARALLEDLK